MKRALTHSESRDARELVHELATLDVATPALRLAVPALRELTHSAQMLAYGMEFVGGSPPIDIPFVYTSGFDHPPEESQRHLRENTQRMQGHWGLFDPVHPEAAQRNRPALLKPLRTLVSEGEVRRQVVETLHSHQPEDVGRRLAEGALPLFERFHIDRAAQLRILLCDGDRLLAWLGGYRDAPYEAAEEQLLADLAGALVRRLRLEDQLEAGALSAVGVAAMLERVSGAAVIVRQNGRVVHANAAAEPLLVRAGAHRAVSEALRQALQGGPSPEWELVRLQPSLFLAIARPPAGEDPRVGEAARTWGLTRRQTEVLTLLCRGLSNKAIASELRCAPSTVEIHVSAIFGRAQLGSRAEVIAAVTQRR